MPTKKSDGRDYHGTNSILFKEYYRRWTPAKFRVYREELRLGGRPPDMNRKLYMAFLTSANPSELRRAISGLIVLANHGLIAKEAWRFEYKLNKGIATMDDLIQEGGLGIIKALEKFNPRRGLAFSTYARYWIYALMNRYMEMLDLRYGARIPTYKQEELRHLLDIQSELYVELERMPTADELIAHIVGGGRRLGSGLATEEDVQELLSILGRNITNLDAPDPATGRPQHEFVPNRGEATPEERALISSERSEMHRLAAEIERHLIVMVGERDTEIFKRRVALDGEPGMPLTQLATCYEISRERVRQIENKCYRNIARRFKLSKVQVLDLSERLELLGDYFPTTEEVA